MTPAQATEQYLRPDGYPWNWDKIATRIKQNQAWRCERCRHLHRPKTSHCLGVHHLDHNKSNCADWNLAALCQRCHLHFEPMTLQQVYALRQQYTMFGVNESWLIPHLPGIKDALQHPNLHQQQQQQMSHKMSTTCA